MSRKCKCHFCKTEGNTDVLFKVVNEKGRNTYYCSENEYNQEIKIKLHKDIQNQKRKELLTFVAEEVLNYEDGQIVPPVMVKKIGKLNEFYDYEVIQECFNVCKEDIQYWMGTKSFDSEFGMASYIMKIIEGNINDVYNKYKYKKSQETKQENSNIDLTINDLDVQIVKKANANILEFLSEEDI